MSTIILFLCQLMLCPIAVCSDDPFDNGANWGGTGLMEIPTARILDDGVIRVGVAQALPFRWYAGGMGVLPGLEFSARLTDITNIPALNLGPDYGSNKDKAFDLKYQVLPESKWFPAVALGLHDFVGTKQFDAQYLVVSRQIFPFDFTVGLGRKRLHGPVSLPLVDELGLFGGVQIALHPRFNVIAEYNPIEYESDPPSVRGVPEGARSPVNVGLRYKAFPGVEMGISYQRGDTLGLSLHLQALLGNPIRSHRADPPLQAPVDRRPFRERDPKEMVSKIHDAIHEAGFKDVSIYTDGKELTAEFSNQKYLSEQKAVGRVLRILLFHAPSDATRLTAVARLRKIPLLSVSVSPAHLEKYLFGEITDEMFSKLIAVRDATGDKDLPEPAHAKRDEQAFSYSFGVKPDFETFLNDPSGFFKYRVGVKPHAAADLWTGAQAYARYDIPFYSNVTSSNEAPPDSVRMDSWKYMGRDYSFDRLMIDQVIPVMEKTFARLSLGYFENMYAGAGGEVLRFFGDGRLALGFEAEWVRKREPESQFGFMDFEGKALLASGYYSFPGLGVTVAAQFGRFLAGDVGWLFNVSRRFDTGVVVGAWYSLTDTDDLRGVNKGYNDYGVFLQLPVRMFLTNDSQSKYGYAVRPWTRDVAALAATGTRLFDFATDLTPANFSKNISNIKE